VTTTKLAKSTRQALVGPTGPRGVEGPSGPQGPAGGRLPAGVTLTGTVAAGQLDSEKFQNHIIRSAVSFGGYLLPERPVVNIVGPGRPRYESETHASAEVGDGRVGRTGFTISVGALVSHEAEAWGTWAVSD
jgi:hypothetical protein